MSETCISQILYEFNIIWRDIMRKESQAIKRKFTLQVQDLRRQLVTKKAFDEDASAKEITRLKKEIAFLNASVYNARRASGMTNTATKEKEKSNTQSGRNSRMPMAHEPPAAGMGMGRGEMTSEGAISMDM